MPSSRLPRITRPAPRCHSSNVSPHSRHIASTAGQPVETIPEGRTTCRATSDSRVVEGFVGDRTTVLFLPGCVQRVDVLRDLHQAAGQCGQGGLSLIHISEPTRRTPISYA